MKLFKGSEICLLIHILFVLFCIYEFVHANRYRGVGDFFIDSDILLMVTVCVVATTIFKPIYNIP